MTDASKPTAATRIFISHNMNDDPPVRLHVRRLRGDLERDWFSDLFERDRFLIYPHSTFELSPP